MEDILRNSRYNYNRDENVNFEDDEYDALLEYYKNQGGTFDPEKIRGDPGSTLLDFPMPSQNKIKGDNAEKDLLKWMSKNPGPYIISDKIDGSSLQVKYENGKKYITSGGDDVKGKELNFFQEHMFFPDLSYNCVVRGELAITNRNFDEVAPILKQRGLKGTNSRNMVNGLVNGKTLDLNMLQKCSFVCFDVMSEQWTIDQKFDFLSKNRFTVPSPQIVNNISIKILTDILLFRREKSEYRIDGIVVVSIPNSTEEITTSNPSSSFAFKIDTCKVTKVINIIWQVKSRYGKLTPVAILEPVNILGTTINRATLHNAKFVIDHGISPGTEVFLKYAGDTIPKIVKSVIKGEAFPPNVPCHWNENKTDLFCDNPESLPGTHKQRIAFFIKSMGIKHCGPAFINKSYEAGITNITKLIRIKSSQISELERMGEKSATRIINEIRNALEKCTMPKLMAATSIFGYLCGKQILKTFTILFPDWEMRDISQSEILSRKGFGEKRSFQIANSLPIFKEWIINHPECRPKERVVGSIKQDLIGQIIVLSGTRDKNLMDNLLNRGASDVRETWNNSCTILVVKQAGTGVAKIEKAKKLGNKCRIMTADEILNMR
jgi:DNA ligase (NAD+)